MKALAQIGYYGQKALIGVQIDWELAEFRVIRARLKAESLFPIEAKLFDSQKELFAYLKNYPGIGILLSFPKLESMEAFVKAQTANRDIPAEVMGVNLERPEDFAWESLAAKEGQHISLIRKEAIKIALEPFEEFQDRIIGLNITEAPLSYFIPSLPAYDIDKSYELATNKGAYSWQGGLIEASENFEMVRLQDISKELELPTDFISLFAAMSLHYLKAVHSFSGFEEIQKHTKALGNKQLIAKALSLAIMGICALFLLGGIFYSYLGLSAYAMEGEIVENRAILSQIKSQERKLAEKNSFFQKAGVKSLAPSKASFYLDRIAALAGREIRFEKLLYKPEKEVLKKRSPELLDKQVDFLIEGSAIDGGKLASFSAKLWSCYLYLDRKVKCENI